ncbi:hypothetical protein [Methyloprofundus sp.]|uniref:hypothetical protein n=1 Tax=Methyloprofundus sp. TaxID=2020875 RepID=UPI003D09EA84
MQAIGVVDQSAAGLNYMQDMAEIAAVKNLTELFKAKASINTIQYLSSPGIESAVAIQAGASVLSNISPATLQAAKQYKSLRGPEGRVYILVGLDRQASRALLENAVKTSMQKDPALWQALQTQKSLDDIAADIAALQD